MGIESACSAVNDDAFLEGPVTHAAKRNAANKNADARMSFFELCFLPCKFPNKH